MKVSNRKEAWDKVNEIFPTDYEKDNDSSKRAGYDIYRHPTLNYYNRICDLGDRLEVLTGEYGETVTNIWIMDDEPAPNADAAAPSYGLELHERIRAAATDGAKLSDFEKFILDRGFYFETEEALKAGYDRYWKSGHGILLTEAEFIAEARLQCPKNYDIETLSEVYTALVELVEKKVLAPSEVYGYAYFKWCLKSPDAIIAYQTDPSKWSVNDCGAEITEEDARVKVCEEWGFEASRIHIIGTPYYDATDWQFIRFNCAHMTWLWRNGSLYQVYE